MLVPVLAGLLGTLGPAFGYLPALGGTALTLDPFRDLANTPGIGRASLLSLTTGFAATGLSLFIVALICAAWSGTRAFRAIERALSPLLAVPHAAAAFGLAFLIAPSGWMARIVSPWLSGWVRPPDLLVLQDPFGISLTAGLVVKEIPFLLLMTLAALSQIRADQTRRISNALGYAPVTGWFKTVFPLVYGQIRLPIYAVLAFSMTVIDVALILGPTTPPPLAVQILKWMNDPDLSMRFLASAGAVWQLALVVLALLCWRTLEWLAARIGRAWVRAGSRGGATGALKAASLLAAILVAAAIVFGLLGLLIWSVAGFWSFPNALPDSFTARTWMRHATGLWPAITETLLIAAIATAVALFLTLACLEAEERHGIKPSTRALLLLYLPLIVPQIAFLSGLQTLAIFTGLDAGRTSVIFVHIIFVLPYVFLSLGDPFRSWDMRYGLVARALGASPDGVLWRVRLPILLRPILTAAAVGFAVSVGQFLPTLLAGAGRVQTLTTEAVALASGGDRRVIAVYALTQTGAAFLPFAIAIFVPAILWRNRRGLRHV
ncbi:ABC transporter permease subunit [Marivita sp. GX14005]|uniref:ABC transporter permease n=1 Tax=Marivita sp. GX14005 TaxID=2942276 RepID=UPI00201987DE|nr:ABC transporter permease subunit [Marivita sp. GX14005]MCL3881779.1 ABC transporter permease subunit [Marivita sp. GX14005]